VHVEVRLFAMQRVQTGRSRHALELPEDADVAAAWMALVTDFPELAPAQASVRFARNGRYAEPHERLAPGDELAVIPPVAGGSADGGQAADGPRRRRLELVETPLAGSLLADLQASVATAADGAVVVFLGQTRETPGTPAPGQEAEAARVVGQRVVGLAYEAFEPMALAVLAEIADEIEVRFGVHRLAIVHGVGEVSVGEASVAIVTAAPHREEAFAACRYAIEELKARAPIWKAERFADGSVWLGAPARHEALDGSDQPPAAPEAVDEPGTRPAGQGPGAESG
jgi:molybdopterin synthase catalytic subunit/molybdopterin converting factor small subunit